MENWLPWQPQLMVPPATLASDAARWVQVAEKPSNVPFGGWVTDDVLIAEDHTAADRDVGGGDEDHGLALRVGPVASVVSPLPPVADGRVLRGGVLGGAAAPAGGQQRQAQATHGGARPGRGVG